MRIKAINPGVFEIEVIVKEIEYGNSYIDKVSGWDSFEATTLKLRCDGCTVMVFRRDFDFFTNISVGDSFSAIVEEWKKNVYTFKKIIQNPIISLDNIQNDFEIISSELTIQDKIRALVSSLEEDFYEEERIRETKIKPLSDPYL